MSEPLERRAPGSGTGFVLGGGGNLGAVQVGMLRAVIERGFVPDVIVGSSVGAVNGAALAADATTAGVDLLAEVWRGLDSAGLFPPGRLSSVRLLSRRTVAMAANAPLRALLDRYVPFDRLEDAPVPLHVVATSLRDGRERWFSTGPLVDAVLASAALPAVLPPVVIDGEPLIDGGVVDNVPIGRAVALGCDRLVVFHVGNFDRPRPAPRRPLDVLLQSFSIARNHRFHHDVASAPPHVELIVLPAVDPGPLRFNDFRRADALMADGYAVTATFLDARETAGTTV